MEEKESLKIIEPNPKPIRLFFFWAGIIATIAYRIIIILNLYSPLWVKIAWYIGTIGFILYFGHRFNIARKKAKLIQDYKLVEAIDNSDIDPQKKLALHYLAKTTVTSKSRWNAGIIFIFSFIALLIGIFMDIYGI
ncbi:MAG TPA: hypothetical protein ENI19_02415 [Candidatus Nealsonbacteria bacterium]|uniref:Uncharacterized protein n=1 Tax=marine sediment metagenome TaxID=412755 RepID=A0A0F9YEF9_9ZZZZ|nr:hypothetical protein [Candidatus Nealsonbacteria bacterium]HEB46541.1 hypothetical protein [Candidatus Nealsonbacteria bacterium]